MISSLYASFLGLVFIVLTIKVIKIRKLNQIAIGDNGNLALQKAISAQANFCQSTPIFLILLILAEASQSHIFILHFCGLVFTLGRIFHGFGINQINENFRFRISGMIATFCTIFILIFSNIILYFFHF